MSAANCFSKLLHGLPVSNKLPLTPTDIIKILLLTFAHEFVEVNLAYFYIVGILKCYEDDMINILLRATWWKSMVLLISLFKYVCQLKLFVLYQMSEIE